jgi:hypothetical protein
MLSTGRDLPSLAVETDAIDRLGLPTWAIETAATDRLGLPT